MFASFPTSCISSLSVVCPSALLGFFFSFLSSQLAPVCFVFSLPLLSFITEVVLSCACTGFPVSLPWSVLLLHSLGFLFHPLWCFCLGVLFFSPVGILGLGFRYSFVGCSNVSSAPFRSFIWGGGASLSPLLLPMAVSVPLLPALFSFVFSHLASASSFLILPVL